VLQISTAPGSARLTSQQSQDAQRPGAQVAILKLADLVALVERLPTESSCLHLTPKATVSKLFSAAAPPTTNNAPPEVLNLPTREEAVRLA
jgi:hypothetical protein